MSRGLFAHAARQAALAGETNVSRADEGGALQYCGFFRELAHGLANGGSLAELVQPEPSPDHRAIVKYLNSGMCLIASPGIELDVLAEDGTFSGTYHIMTDGSWIWPQDLAYYVDRYYVRLPEAFLRKMRSNGWVSPLLSEERILDIHREMMD